MHRSLAFSGARAQIGGIERTQQAMHAATGRLPAPFYRPCHGHFNPCTARALAATGQHGVLWSLMIWDWQPQNADALWKRLAAGLHDGAIIVLHDAQPTTPAVVSLLPRLADEVARRGWHFVTLAASTPHNTCKEP